jgi:hypothetical protein
VQIYWPEMEPHKGPHEEMPQKIKRVGFGLVTENVSCMQFSFVQPHNTHDKTRAVAFFS